MKLISGIFISLSLVFFFGCSNPSKENQIEFTGATMGTSYSIKIILPSDKKLNPNKLQSKIDSLLEQVNQQMSTYIPESEISLFNNSNDTSWQDVSPDFAFVVKESKRLGELSNGALDITIEPIVNLWGFGPEDRPRKIPSENLIRERLKFIGLNKIKIDIEKSRLKKLIPELKLDLSATAKGFGVDKIANFLSSQGLKNFMVEIGGEVRTKGINVEGKYWQIGISTPDKSGGIQKIIPMKNLSMATSGDYWNYFEENGKRFSHTIDPRTGKPITHNLASVTVVDTSCMLADGLATVIDVLGPQKGLELAQKLNLAVYLIVREKDDYKVEESKEFNKLINK